MPSNLARHVIDDLIHYGEVQRGTIAGISLQPLTTYYAEQLGAPNTHGVLVVRMDRRSDSYTAGMRPGDIIVSFDGTAIDDAGQFMRLLSDSKAGRTASLGLFREGKTLTIKVPVVKAGSAGG